MIIIINTATTFKGGGVQVAKSFIEECKNIPDNDYHVILAEAIGKLIDAKEFSSNFHFYKIQYRPATKVFSLRDQAAFYKDLEKKIKPDFVFTTSGPAYWRPKAPHLMGFNLPHYLYPESPFFSIISFSQKIKWKLKEIVIKWYTKRDADAYVVQTDDVNQRLQNWIETKKVYTVTNTYGSQYDSSTNAPLLLPEKKENEFRLLFLSAFYFHKNFNIVNEIIDLFNDQQKQQLRFVLTLPEQEYHQLINLKNRQYVYNTGTLKPKDCPGLYTECDAVFLPTLLECFSATYAEGMKMGLPIITTNLGFAHTVCSNAALYFKPLDAEDALDKINQLIKDAHLQKKLVDNGKLQLKNFNNAKKRAVLFLQLGRDLVENKKNI